MPCPQNPEARPAMDEVCQALPGLCQQVLCILITTASHASSLTASEIEEDCQMSVGVVSHMLQPFPKH